MNLCSDHHDEVCFDGRKCPLCQEMEARERVTGSLRDQIAELQDQIIDLESQVRDLEEPVVPAIKAANGL